MSKISVFDRDWETILGVDAEIDYEAYPDLFQEDELLDIEDDQENDDFEVDQEKEENHDDKEKVLEKIDNNDIVHFNNFKNLSFMRPTNEQLRL